MAKVYSVHAKEALDKRLKEVRRLLTLVETALQKYDSLLRVNYIHIAELGYVEGQLAEVWEFIGKTE